MEFFNDLLSFAGNVLIFGGAILGCVGVMKWISGGKNADSQAQEGATWMIATGFAAGAIGVAIVGGAIVFPTF